MGALALFLVPYFLKALTAPTPPHPPAVGPRLPAARLRRRPLPRTHSTMSAARTRFGRRAAARWGRRPSSPSRSCWYWALTAASRLRSIRFLEHAPSDSSRSRRQRSRRLPHRLRRSTPSTPDCRCTTSAASSHWVARTPPSSTSPTRRPLFYSLLDERSPTRYYHVSTAIRAESQDDLIDELRAARPDLVVFDNALRRAWLVGRDRQHGPPLPRAARTCSTTTSRSSGSMATRSSSATILGLDPAAVDLRPFDNRASAPLPVGIRTATGVGFRISSTTGRPMARRRVRSTRRPRRPDPSAVPARAAHPVPLARAVEPGGHLRPGPISLRQGGKTLTRLTVGPDRPERLFVRVGSCPQWHWLAAPGPAVVVGRQQRLEARLIK